MCIRDRLNTAPNKGECSTILTREIRKSTKRTWGTIFGLAFTVHYTRIPYCDEKKVALSHLVGEIRIPKKCWTGFRLSTGTQLGSNLVTKKGGVQLRLYVVGSCWCVRSDYKSKKIWAGISASTLLCFCKPGSKRDANGGRPKI